MVAMTRRIETLDRARCRSWVEERFSVQQMIEGYERLYRTAVSGHTKQKLKSKRRHAR
jgi:hypothetical protein